MESVAQKQHTAFQSILEKAFHLLKLQDRKLTHKLSIPNERTILKYELSYRECYFIVPTKLDSDKDFLEKIFAFERKFKNLEIGLSFEYKKEFVSFLMLSGIAIHKALNKDFTVAMERME